MKTGKGNEKVVNELIVDFRLFCQEYLFCLYSACEGLSQNAKRLKGRPVKKDERFWLASNCPDNPKYHASMNMQDCLDKSAENGHFSNELAKSLLCTIYSAWDEYYRHKIAVAAEAEPSDIRVPLMGDLRKIRHCILHKKSQITDEHLGFEKLKWILTPGVLFVTTEMFRDFIDQVNEVEIIVKRLSPDALEFINGLTPKEKESFDKWSKKQKGEFDPTKWSGWNVASKRIWGDKLK